MVAHTIREITRVSNRTNIFLFPDHPYFYFHPAVLQAYEARVNDEFVLRGNTAILKCIVPSFVADFVHVMAWIMDNETVTAQENTNIEAGTSPYFVIHFPYPMSRDQKVYNFIFKSSFI